MFKLVFMYLFSFTAIADINCKINPIACHMISNSPRLDKKYAIQVSNIIHIYSKLYKVNPILVSAIFYQESRYNNSAINYTKGLSKDFKLVRVAMDFGIGQINFNTAHRYGIDIRHITSNLEYAVKSSIKILSDFKRKYIHESYWWSRYNSPSKHNRLKYRHDVLRWY